MTIVAKPIKRKRESSKELDSETERNGEKDTDSDSEVRAFFVFQGGGGDSVRQL